MSHQYIKGNFPQEPFPVNCQVWELLCLTLGNVPSQHLLDKGRHKLLTTPLRGLERRPCTSEELSVVPIKHIQETHHHL